MARARAARLPQGCGCEGGPGGAHLLAVALKHLLDELVHDLGQGLRGGRPEGSGRRRDPAPGPGPRLTTRLHSPRGRGSSQRHGAPGGTPPGSQVARRQRREGTERPAAGRLGASGQGQPGAGSLRCLWRRLLGGSSKGRLGRADTRGVQDGVGTAVTRPGLLGEPGGEPRSDARLSDRGRVPSSASAALSGP